MTQGKDIRKIERYLDQLVLRITLASEVVKQDELMEKYNSLQSAYIHLAGHPYRHREQDEGGEG